MPFSNKYKFFFVHIPKCGGSTIENFFGIAKRECLYHAHDRLINGIYYAPQHFTPEIITNDPIGAKPFERYFKFTFMRHPYTRVISEYYWQHQNRLKEVNKKHFEKWLRSFYKKIDKDHKLPQYDYVYLNGKKAVDFIGKVENFQEDFDEILDIINYKGTREIKVYGKTRKKKINFLNKPTRRFIQGLYPKDFELGDYEI